MQVCSRPLSKSMAILVACCGVGTLLVASADTPPDLRGRMQGADEVVVARVLEVTPRWHANEHGDQLIVSRVRLQVEENLKGGRKDSDVVVDVEGGTLDGFTLRVSDLPALEPGERAVFLLNARANQARQLHLRGQGLLELTDANEVKGTSINLDDVRRIAEQPEDDR